MRKFMALCGAVLCFSGVAAAQDSAPTLAASNAVSAAGSSPASAAVSPARPAFNEYFSWQVAVSYEYTRFRTPDGYFQMHGINTSATRFLNSWFGLEGDVGAAFGSIPNGVTFGTIPPNLNPAAHMVFYGGGPHLTRRSDSRIELWVHGLAGGSHFRFTQTSGPGSANGLGLVAGGGADWKLGPRTHLRAQGDYLGTRFFSTFQHSFQIKGGLVFNF